MKLRKNVVKIGNAARRSLRGKAVQHASSMVLALDTAVTEATRRSKFVAPPPSQSTSRRVLAPAANEVTDVALLVATETGPAALGSVQSARRREGFGRTSDIDWWGERHGVLQES